MMSKVMTSLLHNSSGGFSQTSHRFASRVSKMALGLPLQGIKVVEFAGLAPGPFCGKILADWGASVIRVDKPGAPDIDRLSASKRSIVVNSKNPAGKDILLRLCSKADVLIDPFRPGVLERLSLGPDDLHIINPRLIYARITGYGQDGPMSSVAGHDINYCSMSGVLSMLGRKELPPTPPINLLADFGGGGLMAAFGVAMALLHRHNTGEGQVVDCSMTEGAAYLSSFLFAVKDVPPIFGNGRGSNWLDSGSHFYDTYETSDGRYMAVGAVEPKFYHQFITKMELDPEQVGQFEDWDANKHLIRQQFLKKPMSHWCKVFEGVDACVTPVLNIEEVSSNPLHQQRRSFSPTADDPSEVLPNPAPLLSQSPAHPSHKRGKRPVMGQHSREVLGELGYGLEEVQALMDEEVVEENAVEADLLKAKL